MKETNSSSPFTPKLPSAAAKSPAEKYRQPPPPLRVKSFCCSASLSSSPSSSSSSYLGSPFTPNSPFRPSSVIPFSWEKQPGIPKSSGPGGTHHHDRSSDPTLPLPPQLRSNSEPFVSVPRKKRSEVGFVRDPFAVALIECSKEDNSRLAAEGGDSPPGLYWKGTAAAAAGRRAVGGRRRTVADRFGFVDLYASCKTTCSVVESTVYVPRSGRGLAAYGLLNRREG